MQSYNVFTKTCVSYRIGDLKIPRIIKPKNRDMPYRSAIHFVSDSINILYPSENYIKQFIKGGIRYMYNIKTMAKMDNVLGRSSFVISALIASTKRDVNYLKPCDNPVKVHNNEMAMVVYNYGLLTPSVRYNRKINTPYSKWCNLRTTLWINVNNAITTTDAIQLIPINIPMQLPEYTEFIRIDKQPIIPINRLKIWSNEDLLDIQDVIRFFGNNKQYSNLNQVSPSNYKKVVLCFQLINGCAVYYNLGDLYGYIKYDNTTTKDESVDVDEKKTSSFSPKQMQKRIYQLINLLINYNINNSQVEEDVDVIVKDDNADADDKSNISDKNITQKKIESIAEQINRLRALKKSTNDAIDDPKNDDVVIDLDIPESDDFDTDENIINTILKDDDDDGSNSDKDIITKLHKVTNKYNANNSELDIQEEDEVASDDDLVFNDKTIAALPMPSNNAIHINTNVNDIEKGVVDNAISLMRKGVITGYEADRLAKLAKSYKKIPNPFNKKETLEDLATINPEDMDNIKPMVIPDLLTVPNKELLKSKLPTFERVYIDKYLNKYVAKCILGLQNSGVSITDYTIETIKNASDEYQHITITVVPPLGVSSNLHIKLPVIKQDGTYKSNGSIYRLRNQRVDVPIRKINADEVGLSSYYGKLHINRGRKQSINYDIKLYQAIKKAKYNKDCPVKINYINGDVFKIPNKYYRDYSGLSKHIVSLTLDDKYNIIFDQDKLYNELEQLTIQVDNDKFVVGYDITNNIPIYMDEYCQLSCGDTQIGTIAQYIGINEGKLPKDHAFVEIFGASIPIGLVLGYYYGLHHLLNTLGIQYDITTKRVVSSRDIAVIKFADCYLSYDANHNCAPILNSLASIAKITKDRMFMEFEDKDNYNRIFTLCGFSIGHLKEIDSMLSLFIDPITKDKLIKMNEPDEFKRLLIRAAILLKNDYFKHSNDFSEQVIRGYERVPGLMYEQVAKAIRKYNSTNPTRRSKIGLENYAVWNSITNDPTVIQIENINPIHNLKEKESITFTGTGGRKKDTMTRPTRVFLDTDKGIISEATKDSSAVGIEAVMVSSPKIKDFYGFVDKFDDNKDNAANLLSTTALLYPFSDCDDPTRINFINIQASSGIMAVGNIPNPVRSGMDTTISHWVDKLYAFTTAGTGEIIEKSDTHIRVHYDDDNLPDDFVTLGTEYGKAKGIVYPHTIVCDRDIGYKFGAGECLAYNTGFFDRDFIEPTQVVYKGAVIGRVAFMESIETDEDSTIISKELADRLQTYTTNIKDIVVDISDDIRNLVKVGDHVELGDILCNIVNKTVSDAELFSKTSLDLLNDVSADSPKSKRVGVVTRIECYYNGDVNDMSESLQKIVAKTDDYCKKQHKKTLGSYHKNGLVTNEFKVNGSRLEKNSACIRIYITGAVRAGAGDKSTVGAQVKTTHTDVIKGELKTLRDNERIDMLNSYLAHCNRKVKSSELMGLMITLCKIQCDRVCDDYFSDIHKK